MLSPNPSIKRPILHLKLRILDLHKRDKLPVRLLPNQHPKLHPILLTPVARKR